MKALLEIPEQGQIVKVRQRTYTVTEVRASAVPDVNEKRFVHLVNLTSVEDDALGEALQVIWELEVGSQIIERAELPTPKDWKRQDSEHGWKNGRQAVMLEAHE